MRLENFDYNHSFAVFLTICTKDRKQLLSSVVGTGVPDGPLNEIYDQYTVHLSDEGKVVDKFIRQFNDFYHHLDVEDFVIMPNHVHLLVSFYEKGGPSGTPVPTKIQNSEVSKFISSLKRFSNKEIGRNIWQIRSFDHVIRDREDFLNHKKYILENPAHWCDDELFAE